MIRPDIPWHVGSTDASYGTQVWIARVENLKSHLRIIADYLPDEADWLRNQVQHAIAEADRYIADAVPSDCRDSDQSGEAGQTREAGLDPKGASAGLERGIAQNLPAKASQE